MNDGLKILQTALKDALSDFGSLSSPLKQNKTQRLSNWLQLWTDIENTWRSYVKTREQLNSESLWGGSITRSLMRHLSPSL